MAGLGAPGAFPQRGLVELALSCWNAHITLIFSLSLFSPFPLALSLTFLCMVSVFSSEVRTG